MGCLTGVCTISCTVEKWMPKMFFMRHRAVGFVLCAVQPIESCGREGGAKWCFWGDRRRCASFAGVAVEVGQSVQHVHTHSCNTIT